MSSVAQLELVLERGQFLAKFSSEFRVSGEALVAQLSEELGTRDFAFQFLY